MICAGIDAGSRAIKIALMSSDNSKIIATGITDQGVAQENLARTLFKNTLKKHCLSHREIGTIIATGYGRNAISFANKTITEITCHAAGVKYFAPDARAIIDIGGQDSKFIRINENGSIEDFAMNDRCAAGTGCFLEMVAKKLSISLDSLGTVAKKSENPAAISSMCVVFAETEIVGLMAEQRHPADIVCGVQNAIASRILSMAGREIPSAIIFTGGVAMIHAMDTAIEKIFQRPVSVSPQPQMTGAIGAAILAIKHYKQQQEL
ncbi:MAG: acyl-CoA dehydratase activase [Phycisphaerales bacterium]